MSLRVSDVSAASPDMSGEEFRLFVDDIRTNGQLVPIVIRGDEVIDGRKRLAACRELGMEPKTVDIAPDRDPHAVSLSLNVLRTHYTKSQRAILAAKRATQTRGGDRRSNSTSRDWSPTVASAAKEVGVSPAYVSRAKVVIATAEPEIVRAVEDGRLTLKAAQRIADEVPAERRAQEVAKATPKRIVAPFATGRRFRGSPRRPPEEVLRNCIVSLDETLNSLDRIAGEIGDRAAARDQLAKLRTRLSRLINQLGD